MIGNNRKRIIVQDRDRCLLRELAAMRVVNREQAKLVAGFHSTTRANCRLLALVRSGLLRRFFLGISGGAREALYALSLQGAALVGVPYRGPRRKSDELLVADFFVTHQLRVNEVHLAVRYQAATQESIRFVRWKDFPAPVDHESQLTPDGYLEVLHRSKPLAAFLEVDLGHESRKVWQGKIQSYLRYAMSGRFAETFGQPQFRTLVVTDSARRLGSLRAATAMVTQKIFWFTTFAAIRRDGLWAPIWQRPADATNRTLLETS